MHIAHIIMAHKNPQQLARLIKALQHPGFSLYVHLDKKVSVNEFASAEHEINVTFIKKRINCNWGGYSFLKAIQNSLEEVISSGIEYDFINLISGQDYPLVNAARIFSHFENLKGKNFISYDDDKNSDWWKKAKLRFEKYHFTDVGIKGKYLFQKIINKFAPDRKLPVELDLYGSSNSTWWTITAECGRYVLDTLKNNLKLNEFLKYSWGTDEFIIASLIMNSKFKETTINNNYRFIDWSEGNSHPKILLSEDFDRIASSGMIFARKFDLNIDEEILNKIDTNLLKN